MTHILGIPSQIQNARIGRAIRTVLGAVRRHRRDWARLRRRVVDFRYPPRPEDPSTQGEWNVDPEDVGRLHRLIADDQSRWGDPEPCFTARGWITISRRAARLPWPRLIALVAHECGHVATRERNFTCRDGVSSEWTSELCADMYAFKWGFERQIRINEPFRGFGHHCVLPGKKIGEDHDGTTTWWRVDRRFHLRPLRRSEQPSVGVREAKPGKGGRRG